MPRPRSKSTSSLPGNIMASWSIFSYPARPVDHTPEDTSIEKSSSEAVQPSHEKPIMENARRCTSALEVRTLISSSPPTNSPSPVIDTTPRPRSYTTSSLPRNLMASWSIHSKPSLLVIGGSGSKVHFHDTRRVAYKGQPEEGSLTGVPGFTSSLVSGTRLLSFRGTMLRLPQISSSISPPQLGVNSPTCFLGGAVQPTSLLTYTQSHPSSDLSPTAGSLNSTSSSTYPSPVNTICKQDTHLPSFWESQYSSSLSRASSSYFRNVSDAQTTAQAWENRFKINRDYSERYERALSLIFRYWTSQDVHRRNFSNGCLPNEIYHLIIDFLANNQDEVYPTLLQCLLVCKTWSQRATTYFSSRVSIKSPKQLLQYAKVVNPSCSLVQTLFLNLQGEEAPNRSCSIIGTTLLLISRLPNLQQLNITCRWHNDHHPKALRILPNTSVKVLDCVFETYTGAIRPILEFINHFQRIHHLSLTINQTYNNTLEGSPLKIQNRLFQRALPKTKICLKELYLDIENYEIFKLVVNAFMGAKDFASHIRRYSYRYYSENPNSDNYSNAYQELLLHCSGSLQVLGDEYPSDLGQVSLHGLNNLRNLHYDLEPSEVSEIYQQLQTISSSLISEVHFTYHDWDSDADRDWNDIDNLMIQNFPALVIVTISWSYDEEKITWNDCVSFSVDALPKLYQKGILRTLLPPAYCLE